MQLGEFFLRTAYQRIEDQGRLVVVGQKGTGKTASFKSASGDTTTSFGTGLQFTDYPWGTHQVVSDAGDPFHRGWLRY